MKSWEKINIINDNGEEVEAIAPVVISASRSTDIPAFYAKWFFNRLEKGYVTWINPFNRKEQYVSFSKCRFIVFWTKNPKPIIPYLPLLDQMGINYYFQYTINDYEKELLEPNLPALQSRIKVFQDLSQLIGSDKVIWRYDPLLLSDNIDVSTLLFRISTIGEQLHSYTKKLVFSFADINCYNKVQSNLGKEVARYREFSTVEIEEFAVGLRSINKEWNLKLATCSELVELGIYGIEHNRCVDDELMYKLAKEDKQLMHYLGLDKPMELSLFDAVEYQANSKLKDKGQRKECGCVQSKDIGMYNTCNHLCRYCYANHSDSLVKKNISLHNPTKQSII